MLIDIIISVFIGIVWSEIISHFGASILLHRYYCHRQFNVPKWIEALGLGMLMIFCIRSPIGWIASHRMHHHHSDSEHDPHSPKHVGIWKVLLTVWSIETIPMKYARDLYNNPLLVFCHRHWLKILISVWIISFLISPLFFVSFALVPFIFAKVGFGLLNTLGHKDGPTNVAWLNLLVAGEGYHRNHHHDSKRIRLAKWDTAGWLAEKLFVKK